MPHGGRQQRPANVPAGRGVRVGVQTVTAWLLVFCLGLLLGGLPLLACPLLQAAAGHSPCCHRPQPHCPYGDDLRACPFLAAEVKLTSAINVEPAVLAGPVGPGVLSAMPAVARLIPEHERLPGFRELHLRIRVLRI